jgi:hypothetical protein
MFNVEMCQPYSGQLSILFDHIFTNSLHKFWNEKTCYLSTHSTIDLFGYSWNFKYSKYDQTLVYVHTHVLVCMFLYMHTYENAL